MKRTVGTVMVGVFLAGGSVAVAEQPVYEVRTEITAPSGENLGEPRIRTGLENEAIMEFVRSDQLIKLTLLVKEATEARCHPIAIKLERTGKENSRKETNLRIVACEGQTVDFDGKKLGSPSMRISLKKVAP
jgi:hypothetical protein